MIFSYLMIFCAFNLIRTVQSIPFPRSSPSFRIQSADSRAHRFVSKFLCTLNPAPSPSLHFPWRTWHKVSQAESCRPRSAASKPFRKLLSWSNHQKTNCRASRKRCGDSCQCRQSTGRCACLRLECISASSPLSCTLLLDYQEECSWTKIEKLAL